MENSFYGIIIKVENLDRCRSFYRDILGLGAPVLDSNFWVEFKLSGEVSLALEKAQSEEKMPISRGRISWICRVESLEEVINRLDQYGFQPLYEEESRLDFKMYVFCDPEGNPFYVCSELPKE
ncbi:MAG: hypothetical protein A2X49_06220 [Lentisphaerae bacterium GWF2_52_8]|nr:MAG: hypothetical protein A2X49_06220 [Lentisphaerae bacterium GWF2_52_8]